MGFHVKGRIRFGLAAASLLAAAITVVVAMEPWQAPDAEAQDASGGITAIQTPPPVPGIDYDAANTAPPAVSAPVTASGTPAAPAESAGPTLTENNGGYETSLGGSDIAVTSEGGSYEVDGPKRKAKRMPKAMPTPMTP
jgi:hypothetical protein